jgi:uncharacterized protein involved in outer membrane biogenesis
MSNTPLHNPNSGGAPSLRRLFTWPRLIAAMVILVMGVAYIWIPRLVDTQTVVDVATRAVESSTGRTLTIRGPVSVRVWPSLAVVAEDVSFGNASWAADADMATARRVALSLNWLPLLRESVSINKAELDGLVLNLQPASKPAEGAGNWDLSPSATPDTADRSAFKIEKLQLNDASVQIRNREGQLIHQMVLDKSLATFADESLNFSSQIIWRQQTANLKGRLEYPENKPNTLSLSVDTRALNIVQMFGASLPANSPAAPASSEIQVSGWQEDRPINFSVLPKMNLHLDVSAGQIQLPNTTVLPNVKLTASMDQSGTGRINLERFSTGFAKGQISATGSITDYLTNDPVMTIRAQAGDFELARLFSLPNMQPSNLMVQGAKVMLDMDMKAHGQSPRALMANLTGYATVSLGQGGLTYKQRPGDSKPVQVDLNAFSGRADFKSGSSPRLTLNLDARAINLAGAQSGSVVSVAGVSTGKAKDASVSPVSRRPALADGLPWWQDDRPLDFSGIPQMVLNVDVTSGQLQLPNGVLLPNIRLSGRADDSGTGTLSVDRFESGFGSGKISASGSVNGYLSKNPSMNLRAQAGGFQLDKLFALPNVQPSNMTIRGGQVQLDVDLTTSGRSPRQLMAALTGHAAASLGPGVVSYQQNPSDVSPMMIDLKSFNGRADFKPGISPLLALNLDANQIRLPHAQEPPASSQAKASAGRWFFNTEPLGLNEIPLMNGRIDLAMGSLVTPKGIVLPDLVLKANLQDNNAGVMTVDQFKSGFGQGVLMADGVISRYTTTSPNLRLRGHAKNFHLDHLILQMDQSKRFGQVKGGAGEFAFHVEGQGDSLRSLASGLNGQFQLSINDAVIPNSLVDNAGDFILNLFRTVNPLRDKTTVSNLQCGAVYLPVRNGLVTIDHSIGISTSELNVVMDGQVDLKQEQMSINIQSAQKSGLTTGVNPAGLVTIQGTLMNPSLGINKTAVVKQAASVGLAVVTSGISLAAQNLISVSTNSNPCQNILKPWSTIDAQLMSSVKN